MSFIKPGNPAINDKTFDNNTFSQELEGLQAQRMTLRGTAGKFGAMMIMLLLSAAFGWLRIAESPSIMLWVYGSMIVGTILAFVIIFKKHLAPQLALGYALCEGIFLGTVSAVINNLFAAKYPGIAGQAVLLTLGVAVAMFGLYYFRILKATPLFTKVLLVAMLGIALFYLIDMLLHFTGNGIPFLHDSSPLSIGISLFVVGIASLNFVLYFDMIEKGAQGGAPKYYEWYGAFALTMTIVWLYLEILQLLMKLADRK